MALTKFIILYLVVFLNCFQSYLCSELNKNVSDSATNINSSSPCIVKDNGDIYDLSSLSEKNYWLYHEPHTMDGSDFVVFMSICNPIRGLEQWPKCDGADDGVCFMYVDDFNHLDLESIDKNKTQLFSGGKIDKKNFLPEVIQEGSLKYSFQNGFVCKRGKSELEYRTEVHLQCPSSVYEETAGPIMMAAPNCVFIFIWMTMAACPKVIKPLELEDLCIIKFSNSEYPLNLHPLSSPTFYKPQGIHTSFEINICSGIKNGSCSENTAVCNVTKKENPVSIAFKDNYTINWKDNVLVMTFDNTTDDANVEFQFNCDRSAIKPRLYSIINPQSKQYTFKIFAINVCTPQPLDCVIEDQYLNVYDLRRLHKTTGNYNIISKQSESDEVALYHLNMCGPVNPVSGTMNVPKCPEGMIGACQTSLSFSGSRNLGFITSKPVVNKDKSITVLYTGGDSCKDGAKSSSTRISLICSKVQYPPTLMSITDSCEHLFEWPTPAACPVNVVTGEDCVVTDPLFGHNYDLNPLRNSTADYETQDENNNFTLNVCGPLLKTCGDQTNAAVCRHGQDGSFTSGGVSPGELIFNDGTVLMRFKNGTSCGKNSGSSQILLLCSHEEDGPHYIHTDENSCLHHFIWHTNVACPPYKLIDSCSVTDGDLYYDLSPLSDPANNQVFITYDSMKKYVLNVCRSVIHSKDSRCSYESGACLIDLRNENLSKNLGSVTAGPYIKDGRLRLKYENGDACNTTHKYTTIIDFECATDPYRSYPVLEAEEECSAVFSWSTVFACPQNISVAVEEPVESKGNCTAVNAQTGYQFDMNDLKKDIPYDLRISDGVRLLVSACGKIVDERCSEKNSGTCLVFADGTSKSGGKANEDLKFHMWSTYLEYNNGNQCKTGYYWSTKISFICKDQLSPSGPILITQDLASCTIFINWYTDKACERHINCFAHSFEHMFDLSPLVKELGNYQVKDPENTNQTYLLNVCRPLNPVIGVNCHPGSSSCLVRKQKAPLSLGYPIMNPVVVKEKVHLMYSHGSECPDNIGFSLSSKIIFGCNRTAGPGQPTFYKKTHDCQVQFEWQTSLACPPEPIEGNCQIAFEAAKTNIDLSVLKANGPYKASFNNRNFLINVCGEIVCEKSGVCTEGSQESYGLSTHSKLTWEYNELQLTFYAGDRCKGSKTGHRTTQIHFSCDPEAGYGFPKASPLMSGMACTAVFNWKTNLTCLESIYRPKSTDSGSETRGIIPSQDNSSITTPMPNTDEEANKSNAESSTGEKEVNNSASSFISITISVVVLVAVFVVIVYVVGRSTQGQRIFARAKRIFTRKGYASNAENDTLLGTESAFVYRVDEDDHVLRI